jgi:hypothetical protein
MSLRTQLTEILPPLLPSNPSESIKGTELIRLARLQLEGAYSDASLRYHFSIMSCDPASPIAKVEKGQGYYRRTAPVPALTGAQELLALSHGRFDDFGGDSGAVDLALERLSKFRAVVMRYFDVNGRFPFVFRQAFAQGAPLSNLWKFPEAVLVDWETGDAPRRGTRAGPDHALAQAASRPAALPPACRAAAHPPDARQFPRRFFPSAVRVDVGAGR